MASEVLAVLVLGDVERDYFDLTSLVLNPVYHVFFSCLLRECRDVQLPLLCGSVLSPAVPRGCTAVVIGLGLRLATIRGGELGSFALVFALVAALIAALMAALILSRVDRPELAHRGVSSDLRAAGL